MVWLLRRSKIKLLADAFSLSQFQKEHSWIWYHIPDFLVISKQLRILDLNLPFNNCGCGTYIHSLLYTQLALNIQFSLCWLFFQKALFPPEMPIFFSARKKFSVQQLRLDNYGYWCQAEPPHSSKNCHVSLPSTSSKGIGVMENGQSEKATTFLPLQPADSA